MSRGAYMIVRQVFDLDSLWAEINALDNRVPAQLQLDMCKMALRLVERVTAWFLAGSKLDIAAQAFVYRPGVAMLAAHLGDVMPDSHNAELARRIAAFVDKGVPEALASR